MFIILSHNFHIIYVFPFIRTFIFYFYFLKKGERFTYLPDACLVQMAFSHPPPLLNKGLFHLNKNDSSDNSISLTRHCLYGDSACRPYIIICCRGLQHSGRGKESDIWFMLLFGYQHKQYIYPNVDAISSGRRRNWVKQSLVARQRWFNFCQLCASPEQQKINIGWMLCDYPVVGTLGGSRLATPATMRHRGKNTSGILGKNILLIASLEKKNVVDTLLEIKK